MAFEAREGEIPAARPNEGLHVQFLAVYRMAETLRLSQCSK